MAALWGALWGAWLGALQGWPWVVVGVVGVVGVEVGVGSPVGTGQGTALAVLPLQVSRPPPMPWRTQPPCR